ncbi:MAG: 4'-phosphopantetheinyl transferase superfamily protein [Solirubrobacteraceae bacterium]|nr:4'-phosphopantetheinyl transferase superfamily protein [Solirubrobacteraceae bacterium]
MTAPGLDTRAQRVPPPGGMPPPPDGLISVWWATTDVAPSVVESLRADLDRDTLGRVNALVREEDRHRAILAHGLLRRLVAACLGLAPSAISIDRTCANCGAADHGKPTLAGFASAARPPLQFNLAHSGNVVAVALAGPGTEVGIDVEAIQPQMRWSTIRRHVFSDAEWNDTGEAENPTTERFALWARKEAAAKTTGHGLAIDLRHVRIDGPTGPAGFRAGTLEAPERDYPLVVADLPIGHATSAAVAALTSAGAPSVPLTMQLIRADLRD